VSVRLTVPAMVALHAGLDDAGTIRLRQLIAILARVADEGERHGRCGRIHGHALTELTGDRLTDERAKCVLVHTVSL